jgi:hypothetical protein
VPTFLTPLDLTGNELRQAVIQNLPTDPATFLVPGRLWYDTGAGVLKYRAASTTVSLPAYTADVPLSLFDANTILKADTDNTPTALTVAASTILGRAAAGGIDALTPAAARTVLGLGSLATLSAIGSAEITDGAITNLDVNAAAGIALSKLATDPLARANHTGSQLAATISNFDTAVRANRLDQMAAPTASVAMGGQLLTGLATPLAATDAATKAYADSVATGLDVKASVRAGASTNITLASPGAAIDGVTMVAGDRVLLMGQTAPAENGIWVWNAAASAMTRATDADTSAEVTPGLFTFVEEGTTNADRGFVLTTNAPITLGTTGLAFTQFSGGAGMVGTANRITVSGSTIDISAAYVGQASITTTGTIAAGTWQATPVGVAYGGTGGATAAAAKTNLGFLTRATITPSPTFGNGVATSFTLTHNLGTNDVLVELYDTTTFQTVYADVVRTSANVVTVSGFTTAPATNAVRAVIIG